MCTGECQPRNWTFKGAIATGDIALTQKSLDLGSSVSEEPYGIIGFQILLHLDKLMKGEKIKIITRNRTPPNISFISYGGLIRSGELSSVNRNNICNPRPFRNGAVVYMFVVFANTQANEAA